MSSVAASVPEVPAQRDALESSTITAKPRLRARGLVAALLLLGGLGGGFVWYTTRGIESTDNAQVDADVIGVPARVGGSVARVHFQENQRVRAGELLAEIDDAQLKAKLAQAEATLLSAQAAAEGANADAELAESQAVGNRAIARANLATNSAGVRASADEIRQAEAEVLTARASLGQAELDRTRAEQLFASGAFTRAQRDTAQTAFDVATSRLAAARARLATVEMGRAQSQSRVVEASARLSVSDQVDTFVRQARARSAAAHAQVETAKAARELAALELSYTRIYAPRDGVVSKKSVNAGQMVSAGQTIVQLVPAERWVTANFKETQLAKMRPGQRVRVRADAYPEIEFDGEVESLSGATGSRFTLLPPDNATGNFTKVVQRVPVRIRLHDGTREIELRPGLSVEVSVDTNPSAPRE